MTVLTGKYLNLGAKGRRETKRKSEENERPKKREPKTSRTHEAPRQKVEAPKSGTSFPPVTPTSKRREAKWRTEKKRKSENEGTRKGEPKISPLHEIVRHKPTPSKLRTSLPTTSPPSKRRGESLTIEAKWRAEKKRKSENEGPRKGEPKYSPLHEFPRHKATTPKLGASLPATSPLSKRRGESLNVDGKWRTEKKRRPEENEGSWNREPKTYILHEFPRHKATPAKPGSSLPVTTSFSRRRGKYSHREGKVREETKRAEENEGPRERELKTSLLHDAFIHKVTTSKLACSLPAPVLPAKRRGDSLHVEAKVTTETKRRPEEREGPKRREPYTCLPREFPRYKATPVNPGTSLFPTADPSRRRALNPGKYFKPESKGRTETKRKSEEYEIPRKREQIKPSFLQADQPATSLPATVASSTSIADFKTKYMEETILGKGGFGSVYAGFRNIDNLPVAIKHIPRKYMKRISVSRNGEKILVPLEVALMRKVNKKGISAAVALLDWYDLCNEVILILERPVPCLDLIDYINSKAVMLEPEVKMIVKQLVGALIEIHSRGVFHRDIKPDNILIETSSDLPRVRIIDFGCGTFLTNMLHTVQQGTYEYTPPEWFLNGSYKAEPTTVWQIGVVMFSILQKRLPFRNRSDIIHQNPVLSSRLSMNCKHFLLSCLNKKPEARPSLVALKDHAWLKEIATIKTASSV